RVAETPQQAADRCHHASAWRRRSLRRTPQAPPCRSSRRIPRRPERQGQHRGVRRRSCWGGWKRSPPVVTLAARKNKSRKLKVQPLPPDVAELLRVYLADRPAGQPIWGGTWAADHRGAEMLRGDLDAAGVLYAVEGPDGPLFADFHALRHSYLTLGGRAGIDLRTLPELAGHSTPTLTARYSHRRLHDLAGAVEKLRSFLRTEGGEPEAQRVRATGTDGANADKASSKAGFGCSVVARTPSSQGHPVAPAGNEGEGEESALERHNPL